MAMTLDLIIKAKDEASAALGNIGDKAEGLGSKLGGVLKIGALAGGAAVAGIGISAIKSAMDFEKGMSAVGAVAGATEAELKKLTKEALKIGAETSFSASQAAEAMEILAANGISATDIFEGAAR